MLMNAGQSKLLDILLMELNRGGRHPLYKKALAVIEPLIWGRRQRAKVRILPLFRGKRCCRVVASSGHRWAAGSSMPWSDDFLRLSHRADNPG